MPEQGAVRTLRVGVDRLLGDPQEVVFAVIEPLAHDAPRFAERERILQEAPQGKRKPRKHPQVLELLVHEWTPSQTWIVRSSDSNQYLKRRGGPTRPRSSRFVATGGRGDAGSWGYAPVGSEAMMRSIGALARTAHSNIRALCT